MKDERRRFGLRSFKALGGPYAVAELARGSTAGETVTSALEGRAARTVRDLATGMAGLACGQASPLAWEVLSPATPDFVTVSDTEVAAMVDDLAAPAGSDPAIRTSLSGAAGLAPLRTLPAAPSLARALGLGERSCVLAVVTEDALED